MEFGLWCWRIEQCHSQLNSDMSFHKYVPVDNPHPTLSTVCIRTTELSTDKTDPKKTPQRLCYRQKCKKQQIITVMGVWGVGTAVQTAQGLSHSHLDCDQDFGWDQGTYTTTRQSVDFNKHGEWRSDNTHLPSKNSWKTTVMVFVRSLQFSCVCDVRDWSCCISVVRGMMADSI